MDKLINSLAEELEPVKALAHPLLRTLPWAVLATIYIYAVLYFYLGVRGDWATAITDPIFQFEVLLAIATGLSAAIASSWLCIPDMRGKLWVAAVPLTLLVTFTTWSCLRGFSEGVEVGHIHFNHCFHDGLVLGAIPAAAMGMLIRKGATTRPVLMGAMNAIAISAVGYIGLRFSCMMDNIAHGCLYHILPFVLFGGVIGLLARRLYRW